MLEFGVIKESGPDILAAVSAKVEYLLNNRPEELFQLLYRLDVNEEIAKKALGSNEPVQKLSRAIIEREILRQKIRQKYSRTKPADDSGSLST